jgi:hypothetical protein
VEVEHEDENQSHDGHENVEETIMVETSVHFHLTRPSTLSLGCVFEELGYIAYTEATTQILAGTYIPPPGIEAFITNLILEISLIAKEIRAGSVSFTITIDDFI